MATEVNERVYLLMMPSRRHNIISAEDHGKIVGPLLIEEPVLSVPLGVEQMMTTLQEGLCDYTSKDSLLLLGNPIVIGIATVIAAEVTDDGCVRFLKWDNIRHCYNSVLITTSQLLCYYKQK